MPKAVQVTKATSESTSVRVSAVRLVGWGGRSYCSSPKHQLTSFSMGLKGKCHPGEGTGQKPWPEQGLQQAQLCPAGSTLCPGLSTKNDGLKAQKRARKHQNDLRIAPAGKELGDDSANPKCYQLSPSPQALGWLEQPAPSRKSYRTGWRGWGQRVRATKKNLVKN